MVKNQLKYIIDETDMATNLTALELGNRLKAEEKAEEAEKMLYKVKVPKRSIIDNFVRRCSSDEVIKADRQDDKDSEGQVKEGITTYTVRTTTSQLISIGIYESNYGACKDQMAILENAVQKANEKIKERRKKVITTTVGAVTVTVVVGLTIWAGSIKLHDWFGKDKKEEKTTQPSVEATTETPTEKLEDFATPVDAPTDDSYGLEDKYSAEDLQKSIDESNQRETEKDLEDLRKRREDLGLSTDAVGTPETTTEVTTEAPTSDEQSYNDELNLTADEIRASIEKNNQEQMEKQKQYVNDLRKAYLEEYKTK